MTVAKWLAVAALLCVCTLQVSALNLAIINSFDYARQFHNTLNLGDCPHRRIITIKPGSASISTVFCTHRFTGESAYTARRLRFQNAGLLPSLESILQNPLTYLQWDLATESYIGIRGKTVQDFLADSFEPKEGQAVYYSSDRYRLGHITFAGRHEPAEPLPLNNTVGVYLSRITVGYWEALYASIDFGDKATWDNVYKGVWPQPDQTLSQILGLVKDSAIARGAQSSIRKVKVVQISSARKLYRTWEYTGRNGLTDAIQHAMELDLETKAFLSSLDLEKPEADNRLQLEYQFTPWLNDTLRHSFGRTAMWFRSGSQLLLYKYELGKASALLESIKTKCSAKGLLELKAVKNRVDDQLADVIETMVTFYQNPYHMFQIPYEMGRISSSVKHIATGVCV